MLWLLYPFLMAFVIVVTANHFIFDALLGALTAGASAYGATLARARATDGLALLRRLAPQPDRERVAAAAMPPRQHAPTAPRHGATPRARRARAVARRSARASAASWCATA